MEKYREEDDCGIERNNEHFPGMAVLMDCDGDVLLSVQADKWTDSQIVTALSLINKFYGIGYGAGENEKAREIRRALMIYSS